MVCLDEISLKRINTLHPLIRAQALEVFTEVTLRLTGRAKCRITFALRTMAEQQVLYNQGRTPESKKKKEPIVTNAAPGQSYHNWGLAVDFALIIDEKVASWDAKTDWDKDRQADWMEVVQVFKSYGWDWGGDWVTFKDMPHFEKRTINKVKYHWRDLMKMKRDKDGYVVFPGK